MKLENVLARFEKSRSICPLASAAATGTGNPLAERV
jgi:hypothetical protein